MEPLLKEGDTLQVLPYAKRKVRRGDVILYACPSRDCNIVHRVEHIDGWGIRTKGDNNRGTDPWTVTPGKVIGYVAHALSGTKWRTIRRGYIGRLIATRPRAFMR